jgi:hypothetical protein
MNPEREQAIKDFMAAVYSYEVQIESCDIETCERKIASGDEIYKFAVSQRERVIQLERALREYRLKVHNLEAHNQWFERCESQWCHPSEGRLFPEGLAQGDRAALEGK